MPRPASVFSWAASGGAYIAAIPSAIRNLGFVPFSTSVAEWVNQALNDVGDWIGFMEQFFPQDGEIEAGRITGTGDPGPSGSGLFITSNAGPIAISPSSTADFSVLTLSGGDVRVRAGGIGSNGSIAQFGAIGGGGGVTFAGLTVDHDALDYTLDGGAVANVDDLRYAYGAAAPLAVSIGVSPQLGGYVILEDVGLAYGAAWKGFNPTTIINTTANARTIEAMRPLPILANAEAGVAVRYAAVSLGGTIDGGNVTKMQLVSVSRTTGARTTLLEIDDFNNFDDNGGVVQNLDTQANWYAIRITHPTLGAGASTDDIDADCVLIINKYAVE